MGRFLEAGFFGGLFHLLFRLTSGFEFSTGIVPAGAYSTGIVPAGAHSTGIVPAGNR
jgi:hypothetical protein